MEHKIKITADSTNDLSPELIHTYNIEIIPLYINVKEESFQDGVDITPAEIFAYFAQDNLLAKTSAVPVMDYHTVFAKYVNEGYTVIHINLSSDMSSSYQNASIAALQVGNTYVIDSRNLSSGSGHIAILAAELAAKGLPPEEIVTRLNIYASKIEASFIIDTLTYLHKGGRCSTLAQLGANILKLKPCIEVINGEMKVGRKYRGSLDKCLRAYVSDRLENRDDIDLTRIFITHSGCSEVILQQVKAQIESTKQFKEILITNAGCTVSSHCGPNTLGILFIRK